jgi:hypothetical protein
MPGYVIRAGADRDAFIAGLRELADFLTANPDVLIPAHPNLGVFVDAADTSARKEGAESAAAPLGVPVEDLGLGYFAARREFGPIAYSVGAVPLKDET